MTFDPFGDFAERGYLRNLLGEKDPERVKLLEHGSFATGIDDAFAYLSAREQVSYDDILIVHGILFEAAYPWAGQDRLQTSPDIAVSRGSVLFAPPTEIRRSVEYGLELGRGPEMRDRPGLVMGYLCYGHPFLDGNGRALMVTHTHLAERAGISIDWSRTDKRAYLTALTRELEAPADGWLDEYLKPFIGPSLGADKLAEHLLSTTGLSQTQMLPENEVLGDLSDKNVQARYREYELRRERSKDRSRDD